MAFLLRVAMKIKMTVSIAGPEYSYDVDQEIDIENDEAIRLIDAGFAIPVRGKKVETATVSPKETTAAN